MLNTNIWVIDDYFKKYIEENGYSAISTSASKIDDTYYHEIFVMVVEKGRQLWELYLHISTNTFNIKELGKEILV